MTVRDEAVLELVRSMRHSALNHLQVIAGWLQLGHTERAREYIARISERMMADAGVARLQSAPLALVLLVPAIEAELRSVRWHCQVDVPEGLTVTATSADLLGDVFRAAIAGLGSHAKGEAPSLAAVLRATPDGGLALRLESPQGLTLAPLAERAAALGARLTDLGGTACELYLPPVV